MIGHGCHKRAAKLVEPLLGHPLCRQQRRLHPVHARLDEREGPPPADEEIPAPRRRRPSLPRRFYRQAVGNDLQCGDHVAVLDELIVLHAGQRDTLVDAIESLQTIPVEPHEPSSDGIYVDPPGRGRRETQAGRHKRLREAVGGAVLVDVARLEKRHRDRFHAGGFKPRDIFDRQTASFAKPAVRKIYRMRKDRSLTCRRRCRPELHRPVAPEEPDSTEIICARIDTAISAGVRAPMSRPTGPCNLARSASENPASVSRSHGGVRSPRSETSDIEGVTGKRRLQSGSSILGSCVSVTTAVRVSSPSSAMASSGHAVRQSLPGNRSAALNTARGSMMATSYPPAAPSAPETG